jgi:flavorubredoxin
MSQITEVAPDAYRISTYIPDVNLQFNQFLIIDEEPLLFHTGMRNLFPAVRESVATLIDPSKIRWIGFSHLEADECGALQEWQELAPQATAFCSIVGKLVSIDDFISKRPARGMGDGELISTGQYSFQFLQTPHVPHGWDAALLYETTNKTLFCSDLFHQNGDVEPLTSTDIVGRFKQVLLEYEKGPFAGYLPYLKQTEEILQRLSSLKPKTLAIMHGSSFNGDCQKAIGDLDIAMKEILC